MTLFCKFWSSGVCKTFGTVVLKIFVICKKNQMFQKISRNYVKAENSPAQLSFVVSRKAQYRDICRRAIENLQRVCIV